MAVKIIVTSNIVQYLALYLNLIVSEKQFFTSYIVQYWALYLILTVSEKQFFHTLSRSMVLVWLLKSKMIHLPQIRINFSEETVLSLFKRHFAEILLRFLLIYLQFFTLLYFNLSFSVEICIDTVGSQLNCTLYKRFSCLLNMFRSSLVKLRYPILLQMHTIS